MSALDIDSSDVTVPVVVVDFSDVTVVVSRVSKPFSGNVTILTETSVSSGSKSEKPKSVAPKT